MANTTDQPILITGGTGFIGSYLARALARDRQEHVIAFDRDPDQRRITKFADYPKWADRFTFVQGDITLLPHVLSLFDAHPLKAVFHLGALLSSGADANPTMGFQTDLVGTWHVLEAARIYCQRRRSQDLVKILRNPLILKCLSYQ